MNPLDSFINDTLNSTTDPQHVVIAGVTNSKHTLYSAVKGVTSIIDGHPATDDSQFNLFSCTKSMTCMAVLILIDEGKLTLETPAKTVLPILEDFFIVNSEQIDSSTGEIRGPGRKPHNDITIKHLMLHTAGFAYPFTDPVYFKIMTKKKVFGPDLKSSLFVPLSMPLVNEPGTKWTYGHSTDWLGLIVEEISGMRLSEFLKKNIFDKADMKYSTFTIEDPTSVIKVHTPTKDGSLLPEKRPSVPYRSKLDMGGHGCFSTLGDFMKFLRIWLNYGVSPDTGLRILLRSTVENAIKNHLSPDVAVDLILGTGPECDDPQPEGHSLVGCAVNLNKLPTGRAANSLYWGGIANSFYWMDFENDCAGFFGCQKLPFMNHGSLLAFYRFETEVYKHLNPKENKREHTKL